MSDINKDIENLNKYVWLIEKDYCDECNELNVISYGKHCNGSRNTANSIKNVLSELKKKDEELEYDHKEYRRMLRDKDKELEIWKKIAEKLADECTMFKKIQQISLDNEYSNGLVYMTKEEVLDWAKGVINNDK